MNYWQIAEDILYGFEIGISLVVFVCVITLQCKVMRIMRGTREEARWLRGAIARIEGRLQRLEVQTYQLTGLRGEVGYPQESTADTHELNYKYVSESEDDLSEGLGDVVHDEVVEGMELRESAHVNTGEPRTKKTNVPMASVVKATPSRLSIGSKGEQASTSGSCQKKVRFTTGSSVRRVSGKADGVEVTSDEWITAGARPKIYRPGVRDVECQNDGVVEGGREVDEALVILRELEKTLESFADGIDVKGEDN